MGNGWEIKCKKEQLPDGFLRLNMIGEIHPEGINDDTLCKGAFLWTLISDFHGTKTAAFLPLRTDIFWPF